MTYPPACLHCGETLSREDVHCPACGEGRSKEIQAPEPAEEGEAWPEVRTELGRATEGEFEILGELGRGGMAAVYLARDLALDRMVAIKVMAPGLLMGPGMVDRFRQEAVTVAKLHHPNIVTIHTVRQAKLLHFFVMQVVEGGSLETLLARPDPLPVSLTQVILYQVGTGLAYAHGRGVIHRDIKPANVLLDQEGNAILTDFGIAKVTTTANLTQTGSTIGTPKYMSPEQCRAGELSTASDQYSLGIVAYEMLTGRTPFTGDPFAIMNAHTSVAPPGVREGRPDCPVELETAVLRMLAKDPDDRFPGVAEAIEAFGGYVPGPQDPIRQELASLVQAGTMEAPSVRTHLSPITPGAGTPIPAGTPTPPQAPDSPTPKPAAPVPPARSRRYRVPVLVGGALSLGAIATVVALSLRQSPAESSDPAAREPSQIHSITFPNPSESLPVGATVRIPATTLDAEGRVLRDQAIVWSSADSTVAAVDGDGEEGVVIALATGETVVTAEAGGILGSFTVSVSEPAPGELTVSAPRREFLIGEEVPLSANLTDQIGEPVTDVALTWRSGNPAVVEVDPERGIARGMSLGEARITATAGDQSASTNLRVRGQVESLTLVSPEGPVEAGGVLILRSEVASRPTGYFGENPIRWSSSNPTVAEVSFSDADSVVLTLLGEGQTVLTAQADDVQDALTLRVEAAPPEVTLSLSPTSVSFEALEGGTPPAARAVEVNVTGDAAPSVGVAEYGGGGSGWLRPSLGNTSDRGTELTVGVEIVGLAPGTYTASIPIGAGGQTRTLEVQLVVAPNPALGAVEPTGAAAGEVSALLDTYLGALNTKNTNRVRELFPSLSRDALDELLRLPDSDQYYLALQPGSLRLGTQEGTLDGDVMSGVLGPDGQGELRRVIYTFGRGDQGWFIVSFRAGDLILLAASL